MAFLLVNRIHSLVWTFTKKGVVVSFKSYFLSSITFVPLRPVCQTLLLSLCSFLRSSAHKLVIKKKLWLTTFTLDALSPSSKCFKNDTVSQKGVQEQWCGRNSTDCVNKTRRNTMSWAWEPPHSSPFRPGHTVTTHSHCSYSQPCDLISSSGKVAL